MHNVNRNRANAQEQALRRSGSTEDQQGARLEDTALMTQSIDLNHATEQQLAQIESIGAEQARAIVSHRTLHGHFLSWDDLLQVPGMDEARITELQHAARIAGPTYAGA